MYKYTRAEAAEILNVSTRSIDRYVKSGKIRSQKEGRQMLLNKEDVENIQNPTASQEPEVIIPKKQSAQRQSSESKTVITKEEAENSNQMLQAIYADLREEIQKKDMMIQKLSLQLGRAEEVTKNSVSMIEYKKSQYLLQESKTNISSELERAKKESSKLLSELRYEKNTNIFLVIIIVLLIVVAGAIWFWRI